MANDSGNLLLGIFLIICVGQGFQIFLLALIVRQLRAGSTHD